MKNVKSVREFADRVVRELVKGSIGTILDVKISGLSLRDVLSGVKWNAGDDVATKKLRFVAVRLGLDVIYTNLWEMLGGLLELEGVKSSETLELAL